MGRANFIIKMVACMMAIGLKIKWMAMDHFIINLENLHIKECGKTINFKEKENFLISRLNHYKTILIIRILIKLMSFGSTMKVNI